MSFGYSVGDCLTVVLFIKDIVVCLSNTRGSAPEYQELAKELANLEHVLDVIKALPDDGKQYDNLDAIKQTATDCQSVLDRYATRLLKYQKSLGTGQSDGVLKDAAKKIRWNLSMKQDVQSMREYIAQHVATVNLQLGMEGLNATSTASTQIQRKQDSLMNSIVETRHSTNTLHTQVHAQASVLQDTRSLVHGISRTVCQELVPQTQDVSASMTVMLQQNMQLLAMMSNLQLTQPSPDTRYTWFQPPIKFEDAIGNIIPFAQECDFYDLKALIRSRFEPRSGRDAQPGYDKILAEEFELFSSENSNLQITDANFGPVTCSKGITMAFIVGQFGIGPPRLGRCPRPGCNSAMLSQPSAGGMLCSECNAWFDKARKILPRPYRPPELEIAPPSRVHRSQMYTLKRKRDPTDRESPDLSRDLQRVRAQRRLFRNVRIHFTELPATPKVSNVRIRRNKPQIKPSLQATLAQSRQLMESSVTAQASIPNFIKKEDDEGVSAILTTDVDHESISGEVALAHSAMLKGPVPSLQDTLSGPTLSLEDSIKDGKGCNEFATIEMEDLHQEVRLSQEVLRSNMPPPGLNGAAFFAQPRRSTRLIERMSSFNSPNTSRHGTPASFRANTPQYFTTRGTPIPSLNDRSVSVWSARSLLTDYQIRDFSVWSAPPSDHPADWGSGSKGAEGALTTPTLSTPYVTSHDNLHYCKLCAPSPLPKTYYDLPFHFYLVHGTTRLWIINPQIREPMARSVKLCWDCSTGVFYASYDDAARHLRVHSSNPTRFDNSSIPYALICPIHTENYLEESCITEIGIKQHPGVGVIVSFRYQCRECLWCTESKMDMYSRDWLFFGKDRERDRGHWFEQEYGVEHVRAELLRLTR